MGFVHCRVSLSNPRAPALLPVEVDSLVETGALHLCIPEHLAIQLELEEQEKREVVLADGRRQKLSYVGPVQIATQGRRCFTGAMVLGSEVLLGAIPMEDMDLVVSPAHRAVTVNPDSPNIATSPVK